MLGAHGVTVMSSNGTGGWLNFGRGPSVVLVQQQIGYSDMAGVLVEIQPASWALFGCLVLVVLGNFDH